MREVQKKSERDSMCERDRSGRMCLCVRETTFTLPQQREPPLALPNDTHYNSSPRLMFVDS